MVLLPCIHQKLQGFRASVGGQLLKGTPEFALW